jgi:hypothetical protein
MPNSGDRAFGLRRGLGIALHRFGRADRRAFIIADDRRRTILAIKLTDICRQYEECAEGGKYGGLHGLFLPLLRSGLPTFSDERARRPAIFSRVHTLDVFLVNPMAVISPPQNRPPQ